MSIPKVIVVTLNWNGRDITLDCLQSLFSMNYSNFEVVVVDNGSTDGSSTVIRAKYPMVKQVLNEENMGYSLGFNRGLEFSIDKGCDYVLILNNDTIVDSEVLNELVSVAETDNEIGFVSGKVYHYHSPKRLQYVGRRNDSTYLIGELVGANEIDIGQYDCIRDYDFIDDVFLLVRREVIEETRGYSPEFFLYYEEADWCMRVRKLGYRIVYTPDAKIWHKGSMSTGGLVNPTKTFWNARNKYPFIWRNGTSSNRIRFLFKQIFHLLPLTILSQITNGRLSLIVPYIKGNLSGLNWIINRKKVEREIIN